MFATGVERQELAVALRFETRDAAGITSRMLLAPVLYTTTPTTKRGEMPFSK